MQHQIEYGMHVWYQIEIRGAYVRHQIEKRSAKCGIKWNAYVRHQIEIRGAYVRHQTE